ncbi:MAG: hypothetical protein COC06_11975 [Bacteroidales bacterium]|nr:MAG: hypothetical protein COC06_11975 [Bacteroidales bacterium]
MEPKENIQNLKKLVSKEKSNWLGKAKWRRENKAWLDKSASIAIRILSEIRKQKPVNRMSQKRLAEEMGVTPQYINKVVKGKENLTIETICKIERVLGISLMEVPSFYVFQEYPSPVVIYKKVERNNAQPIATKQLDFQLVGKTPNYINYIPDGTHG